MLELQCGLHVWRRFALGDSVRVCSGPVEWQWVVELQQLQRRLLLQYYRGDVTDGERVSCRAVQHDRLVSVHELLRRVLLRHRIDHAVSVSCWPVQFVWLVVVCQLCCWLLLQRRLAECHSEHVSAWSVQRSWSFAVLKLQCGLRVR